MSRTAPNICTTSVQPRSPPYRLTADPLTYRHSFIGDSRATAKRTAQRQ